MYTRIRYNYDETGKIGVSRQTFRVNNKEVRVMINEQDFYFEVIDKDGNPLQRGGKTKNVAVLRKQAKRALMKMGYLFDREKRVRETNSTQPTTVG